MDYQQLLQQAYNKYAEQRAEVINTVNTIIHRLTLMTPEFKEGLDIPSGTTAEEWVPSLFSENFSASQYAAEAARINSLVDQINERADAANQEALRCLSQ